MTRNLTLFDDIIPDAPPTQGIKYAGSKRKLLPQILELAQKANATTVFDGFSGTSRVSQAFAKKGYRVVSNDVAVWSEVFGTCYLLNRQPAESYRDLIDHLNAVPPRDGWFTEHYGGSANRGTGTPGAVVKRPWQIHNTQKLDAIRDEIDALSLSQVERAVALTSLILALDRVDSTLGHYASYLRDWSPRSFNELRLEMPRIRANEIDHQVLRHDVLDVADIEADLAYYDPPYGSNNEKMPPSRVRYSAYYHLWTTVCLNDHPKLFGKALRRKDTSDTIGASVFEEFRKNPRTGRFLAVEAIERLIKCTRAPWIILSYNSVGRATANELNDVLNANGDIVETIEIDYKRNVMADMRWTNDWVRDADAPNFEFLFLLAKS
jgi:adenine-specific DNA-methyltransferase